MKSVHYKTLKMLGGVVIHVFLITTALTCLFPLFWMFRSSLMTLDTIFTDKAFIPSAINFNNYVEVLFDGSFGIYLFNSFWYTLWVVMGIVLISSLAAWRKLDPSLIDNAA